MANKFAPVFQRAQYMFAPGAVGANFPSGKLPGNVYTDWATLYNDIIQVGGKRTIVFTDQYGTATIPSGSWDMTNIIWSGLAQGQILNSDDGAVHVHVADGCDFNKGPNGNNTLWLIENTLTIFNDSSTPPCIVTTMGSGAGPNGDPVWSELQQLGPCIVCTNGAPFLKVADGITAVYAFRIGGGIFSAASGIYSGANYEVVELGANSTIIVLLLDIITIDANTFRGPNTSIIELIYVSANMQNVSQTQTNFLGTLVPVLFTLASQVFYDDAGGTLGVNDVQAAIQALVGFAIGQISAVNALAPNYDDIDMNGSSPATLSNGGAGAFLRATGTVASFTVIMPAIPVENQACILSTNQVVTSFTLSPNTGQTFLVAPPSALTLGQALRYRWNASLTQWWPF